MKATLVSCLLAVSFAESTLQWNPTWGVGPAMLPLHQRINEVDDALYKNQIAPHGPVVIDEPILNNALYKNQIAPHGPVVIDEPEVNEVIDPHGPVEPVVDDVLYKNQIAPHGPVIIDEPELNEVIDPHGPVEPVVDDALYKNQIAPHGPVVIDEPVLNNALYKNQIAPHGPVIEEPLVASDDSDNIFKNWKPIFGHGPVVINRPETETVSNDELFGFEDVEEILQFLSGESMNFGGEEEIIVVEVPIFEVFFTEEEAVEPTFLGF